ncbi:MAG: potassium transporter TrkG [Actinomycetota bacterium]|nr:potassium transporter TrkG [Actinomycetota bacterium]
MIQRPRIPDYKNIAFYAGKIIFGVGLLMILPLITAIIFAEWSPALDFLIGIFSCFTFGISMQLFFRSEHDLSWLQGMVVVSFSWLLAMLLGAIPHYLSGHFGSFLDACFDLMSGYTTTGLFLLQDLDHVSHAMNMWRHLLTYAGGQGIIVVALTFLVSGSGSAFKIYVGEGKDEKLLPNIIQTARAIWLISLSYLFLGSLILWVITIFDGMTPTRGLLHAIWIFMGAWSTGGFAPQSFNTAYYHSLLFEMASIVIMIIGSFNFALHWAVWTKNRREIYRNIEIISFSVTIAIALVITTTGLMRLGVYPEAVAMFRKAFYQIASGHTTTGFMTMQARSFVRQWGEMGMLGVIMAMAIGASACSTAGGFKGLRMGIIFKALVQEIRKMLSPESAIVVEKIHHIKEMVMGERHVRSAMLIVLSYIMIYMIATIVGIYYRYPFIESLFDGVSAGSNTGLSCGLTSPAMPATLKVVYIAAMWMGRLEFMAIFGLVGFLVASLRGR